MLFAPTWPHSKIANAFFNSLIFILDAVVPIGLIIGVKFKRLYVNRYNYYVIIRARVLGSIGFFLGFTEYRFQVQNVIWLSTTLLKTLTAEESKYTVFILWFFEF